MTLPPAERRIFRIAVAIGLLGLTLLSALGRFRQAFALTLGAAVAIVSALWLSDVAGRFLVPRSQLPKRLTLKVTLGVVARYVVVGVAVWGTVKLVPSEIPWLLGGLSAVVGAVVVEGLLEAAGLVDEGNGNRGPDRAAR